MGEYHGNGQLWRGNSMYFPRWALSSGLGRNNTLVVTFISLDLHPLTYFCKIHML